MKGKILDFSISENKGYISGEDNKRYVFSGAEWREQNPPQRGNTVDFETTENGEAMQVFFAVGTPKSNFSSNTTTVNYENEENYNMIDWTIKCLKNYVNFEGRARRKEYWFFYLSSVIGAIFFQIVDAILETDLVFYGLFSLALFLPSVSACARRLHDTNRSGWWMLITFTIIGIIPLIIWLATDTIQEENQWGQPAK